MSSPRDQAMRWQQLANSLPDLSLTLAQDYGDTAVALRKADSIEQGINKNGVEGQKATYSDKPVPTWYFKGKELNQAGRAYVDKNKTGTWYGLRQAEGLRSQVVNLTHTGELWKQYVVLRVNVSSSSARAVVGLSGERAEVLRYLIERYGPFYRNTPTELVRLRENLQQGTASWLNRFVQ